MMPTEDLMNLDVEQLFREHSVEEITEIQKKVQYEIDKKRQSLRTMVGERYRDVITASDTIKSMQQTANRVIFGIDKIVDMCRDIQNLSSLAFEEPSKTEEEKQKELAESTERALLIQIKILLYIPEQIWAALDKKDFLKAAQLFLFSQHVYTGLLFDTANNVLENFPLIQTQWLKIGHFQKKIIIGITAELQENDLSVEYAADYLAAYMLLENISTMNLLNEFIELRKISLKNVLFADITAHNTVKTQTCIALKSIINTIQLLYKCFIDENEGGSFIRNRIDSIISKEATPTFALVDMMPDPLISYLPPIVSDYRPAMVNSIQSIDPSDVGKIVTNWLQWVKESVDKEFVKLLNLVTSVKALDSIREEALKLDLSDYWDTLCQKLSFPKGFNLWFIIFQPLITARVKTLIEIKWKETVKVTNVEISDTLAKASSGKTAQPELDLRWFVWKDEKADVPSVFNYENNKFVAKGLLMKSKGYSPNIVKLCENFDIQLNTLLKDLQLYMYGNENMDQLIDRNEFLISKIVSHKTFSDKFSDRSEIQQHLQLIGQQNVQKLVESINSKSDNSNLTINERLSYYLMTARLLQALIQLCPNLTKCFKRDVKVNPWNDLSNFLQNQSICAWEKWLSIMNLRIEKMVDEILILNFEFHNILEYLPQWSVINIEEQTDDGIVNSQIRVPSQPNFILQNLLFQICSKLNSVIPHTLPRKIHHQLIENTVGFILNKYDKLSLAEDVTQLLALQFLMDVKYISTMLIVRENKISSLKSQEICERFKGKIDPFDYDVFYPYLQNNVTLSAQKTQDILGNLVPDPDQLISILGARQTAGPSAVSSMSEADANVIALAETSSVWFPLLPVTSHTPRTRLAQASPQSLDKRQVKKHSPKHIKPLDPTSTGASSSVRSSAAALFSDWFG